MQNKKQINWQNFNYPPLLKLFHFVPSELPLQHKFTILLLFSTHLIILLVSILNLIGNIIQAVHLGQGIRILYSVLFLLIFVPVACYNFYRGINILSGFMGLCLEHKLLKFYKIIQIILMILWLVFSIIGDLGFNGFIRVAYLFRNNHRTAGVFAIFESIFLILTFAISGYCLYKIWTAKVKQNLLEVNTTGIITKMLTK